MPDSDICFLTATEALRLFRSRKLSPVELLEALVQRATRVEPLINAFAAQRIEQAHEAAKHAERVYLRSPEEARALEGIPLTLKNEHTLIGDSTTIGSSLLRGTVDTANAPITQRLLDAGAVIHAKSNVPEFCCTGFTRSREYGVTRNPWNLQITTGGSSGGSAAALAAGTTILASGSDMGGSIRIPASLCGVVGLKPSYGRVPDGIYWYAMNTYNQNGPLARSVADSTLMFNVINGAHRDDPTTVTPREVISADFGDLKGLSVAVSMDLGYFSVHPQVVRNTNAVAAALRDLDAHVDEVELAWDERTALAASHGILFLVGRALAAATADHRDLANDYTLDFIDSALAVTPEQYLAHFDVMGSMDRALQDVFDRYDVLLCPTMAIIGFPAEGPVDASHEFMASFMTYPFNMLSRHPVLSVPSGFADNGVPTGVQIVGQRFAERQVLRVGSNLEKHLRWCQKRPAV
jgi:Asp-tRNA(Asn)/Glu-tRNA(Gln) amidotransferase A subunit family amidase